MPRCFSPWASTRPDTPAPMIRMGSLSENNMLTGCGGEARLAKELGWMEGGNDGRGWSVK